MTTWTELDDLKNVRRAAQGLIWRQNPFCAKNTLNKLSERKMYLSKKLAAGVACVILMYSQITLADGAGAVAAYYRTMAKVGIGLNIDQQNIQATPTLVRGVYRLTVKPSGQFLSYVNERGTITGDHKGWQVVANPPRKMNSRETFDFRGEVMRHIDFDKLIKVEYGDGGGRKMVMFLAVDCPYCKKFEANAARLASCEFRSKLDTHSTANWTAIPAQTGH